MGQFTLIDSYLDALRQSVQWRPDSDDLVAELTDHLTVSVEREIALGIDSVAAQRVSLDRFGEPRLVSRAFASTYSGGVAVPTNITRRAGLLGMIGAVALFVFVVFLLLQTVPLLERNGMTTDDILPIGVWMVISVVGFAGVAVLIFGLKQRHGGVLGKQAWFAFGLAVAGAIVMVAPWMVPLGALLTGLGALVIGLPMLREGLSPRWSTALFSTGALLAVAAWLLVEVTASGTVDYWGDQVLPRIVGFSVLGALFAPAYFSVARWLHRESAVDEVDSLIAS